jgi:hypothetical protein
MELKTPSNPNHLAACLLGYLLLGADPETFLGR